MNVIIITGASSGLGLEFAKSLDKKFQNLDEIWLVARRKDRLEKLSQELKTKTRILPMDLMSEFDFDGFKQLLETKNPNVKMLVNCAGYGILGSFVDNNLEEQLGMIRLNCIALTKMTYLTIPYMKKNGRIIQLASSAAFLPQQNFAIYAASKSYVLSFSMALNQELKSRKIYVTAVCPGPVETEFFDIAEKHGDTLAIKKLIMVKAKDVVELAIRDSARKKTKSVYSFPIKAFHVMTKIVPQDMILGFMKFLK